MEPKNRLMIVIAVTVLILGAILTSFGRSVLSFDPPPVVLPSDGPSQPGTSSNSGSTPEDDSYQRVAVTPDTVQNVIATLERSDSYYRELIIETYWGERSTVTQVNSWTDDGWTHSRLVLPSGVIRHDLVGDGTLYYWYDGSSRYLTTDVDQNAADLSQHIPTYETVLAQDVHSISDAGYDLRGDLPCVYVETKDQELDLLTRFWVSVESGLLVSAEQEQAGQLVYRMTSYGPAQYPCPSSASFTLPDRTVLHSVG